MLEYLCVCMCVRVCIYTYAEFAYTHIYVQNTFIWKVLRNKQRASAPSLHSSQRPQGAGEDTSPPWERWGDWSLVGQSSGHVAEKRQSWNLNPWVQFPNSEGPIGLNLTETLSLEGARWRQKPASGMVCCHSFPWAFWGQSLEHSCLKTLADKTISCQHLCNLHLLLQMSWKYICIERKMFLASQVSYHDNKICGNCMWAEK